MTIAVTSSPLRMLAAAALVAALSGPAVSAPKAAPTQCRAGETVVYSCPMKGKVVSVCAKPGVVAYRYGPAQAPEIEIASNGRDGLLHFSTGVGGGGGHYTNLRFLRGGYSYIVFSGSPGSLHDVTEPWSGVQVLDGERDVARLECKGGRAQNDLNLDAVFRAVGDAIPEDGDDYGGWY